MNKTGIEILSIDITNRCGKECSFCYNASGSRNNGMWRGREVIAFAADCVRNGVKAISLGGGEPLEHPEIFDIIKALYPIAYLTLTTNGLLLSDKSVQDSLKESHPDKIHISIHNPNCREEVVRVLSQIQWLETIGVTPGVNVLISDMNIESAKAAYNEIIKVLPKERIILLPMRFQHTPTPADLALVAGGRPFQSASCLTGCHKCHNFASVTWDKKVAHCSFTGNKAAIKTLTYEALCEALNSITDMSCGHKTEN